MQENNKYSNIIVENKDILGNTLKRINLQQYQKPKTLIVVHYKGKRISVPLLGDCKNLTQMLYHHIDKFEQTVLKSDPKWEILNKRKIVCFCSHLSSNAFNNNNQINLNNRKKYEENEIVQNLQKYLKYADGDLKIDILLSMIRIEPNQSSIVLDITKYYKYMEIQPYFIQYPLSIYTSDNKNDINPMRYKYYLYRILQKKKTYNIYLARSLSDGFFYSIKIFRTNLKIAQHQVRFLHSINKKINQPIPNYMKNQHFNTISSLTNRNDIFDNLIIPKVQIFTIPFEQDELSQEDQQQRYKQQFFFYKGNNQQNYKDIKHFAIISKYNLKGRLSQKLYDKHIFSQKQLLKYLKQLIWIAYQLHQEYNIIHRKITPQSIQIDQFGNLKLVNFDSWLICYNQQGKTINYPLNRQYNNNFNQNQFNSSSNRYQQQQFQQINDNWYFIGPYTPPQVKRKSKQGYNKFVDYYSIGIIIKQLYEKTTNQFHKSQNKVKLIQKMVNSLTSNNLNERQQIVSEIIQQIKKKQSNLSQEQQTDRPNSNIINKQISLSLSEVKLGQYIPLQINYSCVQNQQNDLQFNGISHQQIINFFKPNKLLHINNQSNENGSLYQVKKQSSLSKIKKKSLNNKNDASVANSRQKSVKSVKSNKSSQKNRTKSKQSINQNKSKSKSHKKIQPQNKIKNNDRNSFTNKSNQKVTTNDINQQMNRTVNLKSKSKQKIIKYKQEKKSLQKSNQNNRKQKNDGQMINKAETVKTKSNLNKIYIPMPKSYKSPSKNY